MLTEIIGAEMNGIGRIITIIVLGRKCTGRADALTEKPIPHGARE